MPSSNRSNKDTATGTNKYNESVTVTVGDWVGFKSDIEQSGKVDRIIRRGYRTVLSLSNPDGIEGDYIGGQTEAEVDMYDCFSD